MTLQNINEKGMGIVKKYRERIEKRQEERISAEKRAFFRHALSDAMANVILRRNHFENATDDKLLDCCIVELTAAEARLNYYLSLAKSENMINDEYLDVIFGKRCHGGGTVI